MTTVFDNKFEYNVRKSTQVEKLNVQRRAHLITLDFSTESKNGRYKSEGTINLGVERARELRDALNAMLGE